MASNQPGYKSNIAANGTAVVVSSSARLERLVINTNGATGNTAVVYNGPAASADPIATIDTVNMPLGSVEYGVDCPNGIYVVTATGTSVDMTVVYTQ
jgi:hypothetical protein